MSQRIGTHLLIIYPPPFDPQWNEEEIARERNQQVHIESVEVEITEDLYKDGSRPNLDFEDPSLDLFRAYRDRISRGDNKLAPERVPGARGSRLHIIRRVFGGKEQRPTQPPNTQSKSLQYNPPRPSHKTYCARQRVVPP